MGFIWFLFMGVLVFGVIYLFLNLAGESRDRKQIRGTDSPEESRDSPREILDRRYAEGELSREEYERMKEDIET